MPDFDLSHVTDIITAQTVVAVLIGGLMLAAFLWSTLPRVVPGTMLRIFFAGLAFLALMGAGRWSALSPHWEAWIGTSVLWGFFLVVAWATVLVSRRVRRQRHPGYARRNGT